MTIGVGAPIRVAMIAVSDIRHNAVWPDNRLLPVVSLRTNGVGTLCHVAMMAVSDTRHTLPIDAVSGYSMPFHSGT